MDIGNPFRGCCTSNQFHSFTPYCFIHPSNLSLSVSLSLICLNTVEVSLIKHTTKLKCRYLHIFTNLQILKQLLLTRSVTNLSVVVVTHNHGTLLDKEDLNCHLFFRITRNMPIYFLMFTYILPPPSPYPV